MVNIRQTAINLNPDLALRVDGTNALQSGKRPSPDLETDRIKNFPVLRTVGEFSELSSIMHELTQDELAAVFKYRLKWKLILERAEVFNNLHTLFKMVRGLGNTMSIEGVVPVVSTGSYLDTLSGVYDKLCIHEYNGISNNIKKAFEDQSKANRIKPAWRYYQFIRPGYVRAGFVVPPRVINQIDTNVTFLGRNVWLGVHPVFRDILAAAENKLRENGSFERVQREMYLKHSERSESHFGGFVPRYQADMFLVNTKSCVQSVTMRLVWLSILNIQLILCFLGVVQKQLMSYSYILEEKVTNL